MDKIKMYDTLCGTTYINLFTLSKKYDEIVFQNFDRHNKEHLFVLGVARGLASVMGKAIHLECSSWSLFCLNRKLPKELRYKRATKEQLKHSIDPDRVLDMLRGTQDCDIFFNFGDIYDEFYAPKEGK